MTNTGAATHEFVMEPATAVDEPLAKVANGAKMEAEAEDIAPGQTTDLLWAFPTPGAVPDGLPRPRAFRGRHESDLHRRPVTWSRNGYNALSVEIECLILAA